MVRSAEGYGGTVLLRDPAERGRYVTIDHWENARAYERFRSAREREYAELDAACASLTVGERSLGRFDVAAPGVPRPGVERRAARRFVPRRPR